MNIIQVYETTKGFFKTLEEAEKKVNRALIYDSRLTYIREYEKVQPTWVLEHEGKYFALKPVELKESTNT